MIKYIIMILLQMAIEFVIHFIGIPCAATKPDGHIQATNSERALHASSLEVWRHKVQRRGLRDFPGLALNPGLWWTVDGLRTRTWGQRPQATTGVHFWEELELEGPNLCLALKSCLGVVFEMISKSA
jgi:hypothetical protein